MDFSGVSLQEFETKEREYDPSKVPKIGTGGKYSFITRDAYITQKIGPVMLGYKALGIRQVEGQTPAEMTEGDWDKVKNRVPLYALAEKYKGTKDIVAKRQIEEIAGKIKVNRKCDEKTKQLTELKATLDTERTGGRTETTEDPFLRPIFEQFKNAYLQRNTDEILQNIYNGYTRGKTNLEIQETINKLERLSQILKQNRELRQYIQQYCEYGVLTSHADVYASDFPYYNPITMGGEQMGIMRRLYTSVDDMIRKLQKYMTTRK